MLKNVSLGIMAFNEAANIGRLLNSILEQQFKNGLLKEIYVVASGCTDETEAIVQWYMEKDKRVKLLTQKERKGKASAINLFLQAASGEILVLESGDTIPAPGTLDQLIASFEKPWVGMAGGRPVPINPADTFIGFTVNLMWSLHHKIALKSPKLGELVAFRHFIKRIPENTAVDEACIEAMVRDASFELHYVPDAVLYNKGPENIKDFIRQRRRIAAGHIHLLQSCHYKVNTLNSGRVLRLLLKEYSWNLKQTIWMLGAVCLEITGRILGFYDFYFSKKDHCVWDIACSTKCLD